MIALLFFMLSSVSGVELTADRFGGRPGLALNNYILIFIHHVAEAMHNKHNK